MMIINGKTVKTNGLFAWDGCHKIYICEDESDVASIQSVKGDDGKPTYQLLPIEKLEEAWNKSCPLRFISGAKVKSPDNPTYAKQGTEYVVIL